MMAAGIERLELAGRIEDCEHAILGGDDVLDLRAEGWAIEVAEPDGVRAADFIAIAGADAAAGGADVFAVGRVLIECAVLGEVPGKMTWARSLMRRLSAWPAPRLASSSSSSITRAGLITTPVAMTHVTPGVRMPLGSSESL